MTTFFQSVFSRSLSQTGKAPSFNDFSLHVAADTENELDTDAHDLQVAAPQAENVRPKRTNVWQDTFSPQMNSNMKRLPASYYDAPSTDKQATTVWEEIIKAETVRRGFDYFDNNQDGVIDANDLRAKLGNDANVAELIKKADKNNDGQIDRLEFCEMLKSM